jgi:hypothetical protein
MASSAICSRSYWRQLTGCMAAFALVFHSILLGFSGASLAVSAPAGDGLAGFELCLHNADGGAVPSSDIPTSDSDCSSHCKYCVLAALQFFSAPEPSLLPFVISDAGIIGWQIAGWRDDISAVYPSQRPRGPPLSA